MNQRLKELMIEAGYAAPELATRGQQLAQLIVAECVGLVEPTPHHEVWAQSYLGGVDGLELLHDRVALIKKHFGIDTQL